MEDNCRNIQDIKESIFSSNSLDSLIPELISTKQDLRSRISPRYKFDERWNDFEKCLFLDGYKIENNILISIEANIDGVIALEDDFTIEINNSTFSKKEDVKRLINESAEAFKRIDYNQCLSKSRIALETLVRTIAIDKYANTNDTWGSALSNLKTNSFLTQVEEDLLAKTYSFLSNGSHIPLGYLQMKNMQDMAEI
ncbi:hypothetical protein [Aliarcobacter butzleri]|uniref:Uncharacterized protein n=1 Tax=Aliarcobacter butzleri L352 TaxID=1447260 RepID=A0A837JD99_9BACT|nr:hypothetical protein [Aliarcobacter butzleri]KLE05431.1 hypothetical protein AF77_04815 [Aliarcobacter butzleri L352]